MKKDWTSVEAIATVWIMLLCNHSIVYAAYLADGNPADTVVFFALFFISIPLTLFPPLMALEIVIFDCVAGVFRQFLKLARRHN
jgi:hypothetical protein